MDKCADKCGTQVNKLCWTTCIGLPGAAANLAVCAANVGCVGVSEADNLVMNVYEYVQDLARERLQ